jgi:beta-glucanase (GH16 family)
LIRLIGVLLSGYLVYDGLASVEEPTYCSAYEIDFTTGGSLDESIWKKEVEVGGYGNGQFEYTTNTDENVFIKDGLLTLKPTLQDSRLMETNNTINLTANGLCTSDVWSNCVISTNTTNGTIVNPVKSARISTTGKKGASIQYGRIEVVAKMPQGDWLWPAIWMLPVNDTYGPWPTSGEVCCLQTVHVRLADSSD